MVYHGKYIHGMEEEIRHVPVVGPRQTCALCSFASSQMLITVNRYSGFGEEHPLVCYHLSGSLLINLHRQLAPQSSKT